MRSVITENVFIQIIGKAIAIITSIVSTALIARKLGPDAYGNYTIIFIYLSFVAVLIDLGLQTIAVREASSDERVTGRIAGALFWIKIIWGSSVLVMSSLLFSLSKFGGNVRVGFLIAALGLFFVALASVPHAIFQTKLKLHYAALLEVSGQSAFLALVAVVFFLTPSPEYAFYSFLIVGVISSIIGLLCGFSFAKRLETIEWSPDSASVRRLLKSTLPLTFVILLSQIHFKGDSLLLSLLKSERDIGIYGFAYKFFETSILFPGILMSVVFPILSRHHSDDANMNELAGKTFKVLAITGGLAAVLIVIFAPELVFWIGGNEFSEAVFPLRMLGVAVFFSFLTSICAFIVIAKDRQKDMLYISASVVILNLFLNAAFIPLYSFNACAVVTAVSECCGMILMAYLANKASGFNPFQRTSIS